MVLPREPPTGQPNLARGLRERPRMGIAADLFDEATVDEELRLRNGRTCGT